MQELAVSANTMVQMLVFASILLDRFASRVAMLARLSLVFARLGDGSIPIRKPLLEKLYFDSTPRNLDN